MPKAYLNSMIMPHALAMSLTPLSIRVKMGPRKNVTCEETYGVNAD